MADVTLSAAVRSSLLSLQGTTDLIDRTQGRLSTGLKVAGPIDDPVAFFQAKSLDDRVFDFTEKKDAIDQGVSTLSSALDGVNAIESLVRQLKGVGNSMKSASAAQFADLITQYNDLRTQINNLAADSSYQGTNLVNGTGESLTVEFSDLTAAQLSVASVDLTVATAGLGVGQAVAYTAGGVYVSYASSTGTDTVANTGFVGVAQSGSLSLTWEGGKQAYTAGATISATYGTQTVSVLANVGVTLNAGDVITANVDSAAAATGYSIVANGAIDAGITVSTAIAGIATDASSATMAVTWGGAEVAANTSTTHSFAFGTATVSIGFDATGVTQYGTLTAGEVITVKVISAQANVSASTGAHFVFDGVVTATTGAAIATSTAAVGLALGGAVTASTVTNKYVSSGDTASVNRAITELDTALTTLRSQASKLGSNVALLQTRLNFTESYVNTLSEGSSKLTLADLNSEGANLLALQTRQQLGIQALAFAGQAEQSILRLFG